MAETDIEIGDEIIRRTIEEVERAVTKELCDNICAKTILSQVDKIGTESECENRKKGIMKALLASAWTQRLYFDFRSAIMGLTGVAFTFLVIWYYGSINLTQYIVLAVSAFFLSLFISRLFDGTIVKGSRKITRYLAGHKRLREIILKNF